MKKILVYGLLILSQTVFSKTNCHTSYTGCAGRPPACSGTVSCGKGKCTTDVTRSAKCFKTVKNCDGEWKCSP